MIVEQMLITDDILLNASDLDGEQQYRLVNYQLHDFEKIACLLDRNIVTDLVKLIRGAHIPDGAAGQSLRVVAGLQAFLNAADILSDPGLAYNEFMDSAGLSTADTELALFRSADNLDANIYLDIALGLRSSVPPGAVPHFESGELQSKTIPPKLKPFERNIVTIKKALAIKASEVTDYQVMLQLTDWLFEKYMFTPPAFFFLCLYLSNGRISRMLKSHELKDVRNAAWDLCFLQHWYDLIKRDQNIQWLAATRDRAIREVARIMFIKNSESEAEYFERLSNVFKLFWGVKNRNGMELLERIKSFQSRIDHPQRSIVCADSHYIEQLSKEVDDEYSAICTRS
ncbi:hypothetical protein [Methylobacter sp. sgz302048]|uniref:hypothetical protein n=1 Tax=Methylobacter sp. sgz302048 TaxID=3455945 RepID=UPI003FA15469